MRGLATSATLLMMLVQPCWGKCCFMNILSNHSEQAFENCYTESDGTPSLNKLLRRSNNYNAHN